MSTLARMRVLLSLSLALAASACGMPNPFRPETKADRSDMKEPFDPPKNYPAWAFDQPAYAKPAAELTPEPKVRPDDPLHYFTKDKLVMIRQPSGYTPEELPRVAVWWTDNNGFHWHRAGYFGRQQSFFPFEVEEDGDYGVRFVGPGQEPAQQTLAYPERVYHVDSALPEVTVTIEPEQAQYHVGQTLTLSWRAADYHLIEYPVCASMILDESADQKHATEIQRGLADTGSITYEIPADAVEHQIQFRFDALDRAGNLGTAFSQVLQVVPKGDDVDIVQADAVDENLSLANAADDKSELEPTPAPFPSQAAREPASDAQLIWDGPASAAFPNTDDTTEDSLPSATALNEDSSDEAGDQTVVPQSQEEQSDESAADETTTDEEPTDPEIRADAVSTDMDKERPDDDLTSGNGLLVPLPATLDHQRMIAAAVAHPWRTLGHAWEAAMPTIWTLAKPQFSLELGRLIEGRILADNPAPWPIAEPAKTDSAVARGEPAATGE